MDPMLGDLADVDGDVLAALLASMTDVDMTDETAELEEIISSQAVEERFHPAVSEAVTRYTQRVVDAASARVSTANDVLVADSQPVVPVSPLHLAGAAAAAADGSELEPATPRDRVSTVVLPLVPAGARPGWLRKGSREVPVPGDDDDDGDAAGAAADMGSSGRAAASRIRRELFPDVVDATSPPAARTSRQHQSDRARRVRDDARPHQYGLRPVVTPAMSPEEQMERIEGVQLDRIARTRQVKLNWATRKKFADTQRRHVINWLVATHPDIVQQYEASAMNSDGVHIKDLL